MVIILSMAVSTVRRKFNCSKLSIIALTWSDEDMCLFRVDVLKFVQPVVKGFFLLVLIQKDQVICCLLASYCSHSLYFVSVDHCCWNLRGAGTPDDSFFSDLPLSEGFSKFVVIASFWFSSVAVGFALFYPAGAKYEDICFVTLTYHA